MLSEQAKEARRRYNADYRAANRPHIREKAKQWDHNNREKRKAINDAYWERKAQAMEPGHHCMNCNEPFAPKRSDAKFCSARCRVAFNRKK